MSEFSYTDIPITQDELVVLMNNMQFRTCKIYPNIDPYTLFFTDCTHPAQNAVCDRNKIVKWKLNI